MMASLSALALLLAVGSPLVSAQSNICYNRFGQAYRCNGLNNPARIGIGVAVGVGVLLLICLIATMRRRSLQRNFARYRPPATGLPYAQNNGMGGPGGNAAPMGYSYGQGNNPYANNPPPPQGYQGQQDSSWNNSAYGGGVSSPAATYQPGARAADAKYNAGTGTGAGQNDHEHGYEWEQAREQERIEREQQQQGMGAPPPGYDASVGNSSSRPIVSGTTTSGNDGFAPPPGPPPTK